MPEDYEADIQKLNGSDPLAPKMQMPLRRTLGAYVRSGKGKEAIAYSGLGTLLS
jgi:hypothetical protein